LQKGHLQDQEGNRGYYIPYFLLFYIDILPRCELDLTGSVVSNGTFLVLAMVLLWCYYNSRLS